MLGSLKELLEIENFNLECMHKMSGSLSKVLIIVHFYSYLSFMKLVSEIFFLDHVAYFFFLLYETSSLSSIMLLVIFVCFQAHLVSSQRCFISRCEVTELSDSLSGRGNPLVLFLFSDVIEVSNSSNLFVY